MFRLLPPLGILKNLDGWPVLLKNDNNQDIQAINLKTFSRMINDQDIQGINLKTWRQVQSFLKMITIRTIKQSIEDLEAGEAAALKLVMSLKLQSPIVTTLAKK